MAVYSSRVVYSLTKGDAIMSCLLYYI